MGGTALAGASGIRQTDPVRSLNEGDKAGAGRGRISEEAILPGEVKKSARTNDDTPIWPLTLGTIGCGIAAALILVLHYRKETGTSGKRLRKSQKK